MNKHIETMLTLAASALLIGTITVGCQDTGYPAATPATSPSTNQARFLFVNTAPDAPAVNFLVENNPAGTSLAFGQASTAYVPSQVGLVQLRAKAASGNFGGILGTNDAIYRAGATNQTNFASAAGGAYTVFLTDTLNRPKPTTAGATNPGGPQFLIVTDNLSTTLTSGANVRVMNLSPDAAVSGATSVTALSVRLSVPSSSTALPTAVGSFNNRAYRAVSAAFSNIPANTYKVDVFSGATLPSSTTVTPLTSTTVTLDNTKFYTLYTQGVGRKKTLSVGKIQHN